MPTKEQYRRDKARLQQLAHDIARAVPAPCKACGRECDGTLMRCMPRTAAMLQAEAPRHKQGWGIQLCHWCQRCSQLKGGVANYLATRLRKNAQTPHGKHWTQLGGTRGQNDECPYCAALHPYWLETVKRYKCSASDCHKQWSPHSASHLAGRKLPDEVYEKMAALLSKRVALRRIAEQCDVDYHTAWRFKKLLELSKQPAA